MPGQRGTSILKKRRWGTADAGLPGLWDPRQRRRSVSTLQDTGSRVEGTILALPVSGADGGRNVRRPTTLNQGNPHGGPRAIGLW